MIQPDSLHVIDCSDYILVAIRGHDVDREEAAAAWRHEAGADEDASVLVHPGWARRVPDATGEFSQIWYPTAPHAPGSGRYTFVVGAWVQGPHIWWESATREEATVKATESAEKEDSHESG